MKILHLIETLDVGGAEQSLLQILPRLRASEPRMCHIYQGARLKPAYEAEGIPVFSLDLPPKYHFVTAVRQVEALVQQERPALIHTTLFRAEVVGRIVGARLGIPVVCSFVSECYADIRWRTLSPAGRVKLKGVQLVDRLTAPWASHFIANSDAVKHSESRSLRVSLEKISVIHRGRDPAQFLAPVTAEHDRSLRASLDIPAGAPIAINVGRLVDSKGQAELVEAFARVASALPEAVLLIAGEGPERDNLTSRVQSSGLGRAVRLLGRRDDVPQLLALANVFAFPSHYEGHPGAVVEAMFAGKPIVVSDIPVHRETITHEVTGLVVPLRDPEALAAAMLSMLRHPESAAAMGARAREAATQRFHIDRSAAQYDALYGRVIAEYASRHSRRAAARRAAHEPG
jgi:glycosyltransferase involved in cell wall biosynthesis